MPAREGGSAHSMLTKEGHVHLPFDLCQIPCRRFCDSKQAPHIFVVDDLRSSINLACQYCVFGGVQPPSQDKWITCITFCGIGFPTQQNSWTKNRWNMAEQYGSHVIFPNGRGVSSPCAWEFGPRHALAGVTRPRKPGDRRIG